MLLPMLISLLIIAIVGLVVVFPIYWIYVRYICHTFWIRRYKIRQINPPNLLGNYGEVIREKTNLGEYLEILYKDINGDYVGTYFFTKPILVVKDPQLIEQIITDDVHFKTPFSDEYSGEELSPKTTIDRRNEVLNKISSYLTPNTLSSLHGTLVQQTVQNLLVWISDEIRANSNNKIEINQIISRYSLDLIGNIAFGTEVHSIGNQNVTFRKMTHKLMRNHWKRKLLGYSPLAGIWRVNDGQEVEKFFDSLVRLVVNYRENNQLERIDLLQLFLQLRNGNKFIEGRWKLFVQDDATFKARFFVSESSKEISLMEITMILKDILKSGLDQSTSALNACLMEVGRRLDIQNHLNDEIWRTTSKKGHGEHLSYQELNKLELLDCFVKETLRLHPCQPFIERRTCNQFILPGKTAPLPEGTFIFIPVAGIHHDKQHFENPDKFILKRLKETQPQPFTYFPYGNGLCFFDSLIEMSLKTVLCEILMKFKIRVVEEVKDDYGEKCKTDSACSIPKSSVILEFSKKK